MLAEKLRSNPKALEFMMYYGLRINIYNISNNPHPLSVKMLKNNEQL